MTSGFKSSRNRVRTHYEKPLSSRVFFDLILLHRHPLQHLFGIIVTPLARHISLLLNSHRSSDSHHYTFPKIPSYHHFFVIVPSVSMLMTSARATPYHRARRAVQARAAPNQHARQQICLYRNTNINAPTHAKPARALLDHRAPLQTSVRRVHVCIYFPKIVFMPKSKPVWR